VREINLVLAKFLACMAVNTVMLLLSLTYAWCCKPMASQTGDRSTAATWAWRCSRATLWRSAYPFGADDEPGGGATIALGFFWALDDRCAGLAATVPLHNIIMSVSLLGPFHALCHWRHYVSDVAFL